MNLPEFSVNRRVTISMLILIIVLFGIISFFGLGMDLMPEMEYPILTVVTRYPGVAAEDVEELVTRPIEEIVSTIKGLKNINSISEEGVSSIIAEFEWGTNLDFTGQDIRDQIDLISMFLPEDIEEPLVIKMNISQMPVIVYGITGMENTRELRTYIDDNIAPRIERVEGVAMAMAIGGLMREINIFLDRTKLDLYKINPEQVIVALYASNMNTSGGYVKSGNQEYLVRTIGQYQDIQTIKQTIISNSAGTPIRVRDIARVVDTNKETRDHTRLNGKDAVIFFVSKQSGANTVNVIRNVMKALDDFKSSMPSDVEFYPVMNQGEIIERIIFNTSLTALIGGILAILILYLFLRNWRPTITIAVAIPLSIITSFIGLYGFGYTFNILTLGGFALAVGMLVDNAVVVIENIYRHLEHGKSRKEAAKIGATEVGMAITASTLTTFAVFVPMTLGGGMAGKMSRPLATTICIGLLASLFVALTIVPMMASVIFKKRTKEEYAATHGAKSFVYTQNLYKSMLRKLLEYKKTVVFLTFLLFAASIGAIFLLGAEFMPSGDMGMAIFSIKMPVGTNLEETNRVISTIESRFNSLDEKRVVMAMVGPSEESSGGSSSMSISDVNEAMIMMRLTNKEERDRSTEEIIDELRSALPQLHGATMEFMDMSGMMMGSATETSPVTINIFGKDLAVLREKADIAMNLIKDIPGLRDINVSMREGKPELRIIPDRDKAASMGLSVAEIGSAVRRANLGQVVTRFREKGDEIDVRIRLEQQDRSTDEDIRMLPVVSRIGIVTPIANVANLEYTRGPIKITREDRVRKIIISANIKGRDVQSIVSDIKDRLKDISLPSGYFIEYGGSYKQMNETMVTLLQALAVAIILIYMIMAAQFESLSQPFVIMFTVPLALIGVVLGLGVFGFSVSVPAFMGFIILSGIVVNNGIVMIDYVNQLRNKGLEKQEALVQAASTRLRPILITAITTIVGILPMALSRSQGSEMRAPMGVAVAFGLISSTLLTLFVIPVFYSIVDHISYNVTGKIKKKVLGHEDTDN